MTELVQGLLERVSFDHMTWGHAVAWSSHIPVYWATCLFFYLIGWGRLTPAQEKKNKIDRVSVLLRVLEVQASQAVSYVAISALHLMPEDSDMRWYMVVGGLLLFDLVEYVMHRIYHHRLLYKRVHKAHHLLWCPYPYSALYNSRPEFSTTGAVLFLVFRTAGFTLPELVFVNLLGTLKTIHDHTWRGSKDEHHWVHHEVSINSNFEQPWTDIYDRLFATKYAPKDKRKLKGN